MTIQEFGIGVNIIQACTQKKFAKEQLEIYYNLLQHLTVDQLKAGLERMFRDRVYSNIPMPAEIIQYCEDKKDIESIALLAREEFKQSLKISMYDTIAFSNIIQHKIYGALGGRTKALTMPKEELDNFIKFEYVKLYKAYSDKGVGSDCPLLLLGKHDLYNEVQNPVPTKLIGSPERYKEVCLAYTAKYKSKAVSELLGGLQDKVIGVE